MISIRHLLGTTTMLATTLFPEWIVQGIYHLWKRTDVLVNYTFLRMRSNIIQYIRTHWDNKRILYISPLYMFVKNRIIVFSSLFVSLLSSATTPIINMCNNSSIEHYQNSRFIDCTYRFNGTTYIFRQPNHFFIPTSSSTFVNSNDTNNNNDDDDNLSIGKDDHKQNNTNPCRPFPNPDTNKKKDASKSNVKWSSSLLLLNKMNVVVDVYDDEECDHSCLDEIRPFLGPYMDFHRQNPRPIDLGKSVLVFVIKSNEYSMIQMKTFYSTDHIDLH